MNDQKAMKILLKNQAKYRRQGKPTSWLQGYAKAFMRTHNQLKGKH